MDPPLCILWRRPSPPSAILPWWSRGPASLEGGIISSRQTSFLPMWLSLVSFCGFIQDGDLWSQLYVFKRFIQSCTNYMTGIRLKFKTKQRNGLLLFAASAGRQEEFLVLQFKSGRPWFIFDPQGQFYSKGFTLRFMTTEWYRIYTMKKGFFTKIKQMLNSLHSGWILKNNFCYRKLNFKH